MGNQKKKKKKGGCGKAVEKGGGGWEERHVSAGESGKTKHGEKGRKKKVRGSLEREAPFGSWLTGEVVGRS